MGQELAHKSTWCRGQLSSLIDIISENVVITEEQAAAARLLAELPERDVGLTRQMIDEGVFQLVISRVIRIRQGETKGSRFMTPYLEGLVRILARITFVFPEEPETIRLCQEHNIASIFTEMLQANGLDNVQMVSAMSLDNLSQESKNLTKLPELPSPGFCVKIFPCFSKTTVITGLCRVHRGRCSLKDTFCLVEGQVLEKLVALLDHTNAKVVEASLAAMSTLLEDEVDIENGVTMLCETDAVKPILTILMENRTETLRRRAVWVVERLLRGDDIATEVSDEPNVITALVDAFQHGDYRTRQIAERALKHTDKIPNFSGIFPNLGQQ